MWADELEEAAGRLQTLVRGRFKRLSSQGRRVRPISKVRPHRKRRFGSSWKVKPAPIFRALPTVQPGKGPPKSPIGG